MNLNGWDTFTARRVQDINALLAANPGQLPDSFDITLGGFRAQGTLGAWVIDSGAGDLLQVWVPITGGTFTTTSGPETGTTDLADISVGLEIGLALLPIPSAPGASNLVFDIQSAAATRPPNTAGVVSPWSKPSDPNQKLSAQQLGLLPIMVATSLAADKAKITFLFAQINVIPSSGGPAPAWLRPRTCAFEFYKAGDGTQYLAMFGAVDGRDVSTLSHQIDNTLLAGDPPAVFAISAPLLLQNVVQPALPACYGNGVTAASFAWQASSGTIVNQGSFNMAGITEAAETYTPVVNALSVGIDGGNLSTSVSGGADLTMGISMTFSVACECPGAFNLANGTLAFSADPSPKSDHDSSIPWYDYLMGPMPDIIMAIVIPIIAKEISSSLSSTLQQSSFVQGLPLSVRWAGMQHFTIQGGELNSAFRLWGVGS